LREGSSRPGWGRGGSAGGRGGLGYGGGFGRVLIVPQLHRASLSLMSKDARRTRGGFGAQFRTLQSVLGSFALVQEGRCVQRVCAAIRY